LVSGVLDEVIDEIFTTLTQRQTIRRLDTETEGLEQPARRYLDRGAAPTDHGN
jgi:hypothetical protein